MVKPKKATSGKKKGGTIDFKKIKRKIGRKLPPPKNATNTQIKSKPIVLPEQSVATNRAGLAVSSKGLTLRELLHQTSHHNAKTRKFALHGIKDLLGKNPSELKLHKLAIIEKLRERFCDNDKVVRDTLYNLLKTVIFVSSKEDITGPTVSLMMPYVFNAMTNLALDIRLMAFKLLDLIISTYPHSFSLNAEKVIYHYRDILQNNHICLGDRSKVKNVIGGLVHCLSLLHSETGKARPPCEQEGADYRPMHAFAFDTKKEHHSHRSLFVKVEELIPILSSCFHDFATVIRDSEAIDATSFDCLICILQCVKLATGYIVAEVDRSVMNFTASANLTPDSSAIKNSANILKRLCESFPIGPNHQITEKEEEKYFILNVKVAEIYLQLNRVKNSDVLLDRFLQFLEYSLYGQISSNTQSNKMLQNKYLISLLPIIPRVVTQVADDWRNRLLKAFTNTFQDCKVDSKLTSACLDAMEEMLLPEQNAPFVDCYRQDLLAHRINWLRKLHELLLYAGDKNPLISKAILKLIILMGQSSSRDSLLDLEYNDMQFMFREFYCVTDSEGKLHHGPFRNLPTECQELAICCLHYFSSLNSHLLRSLAYCCSRSESQSSTALRIIGILKSSYKDGHIQTADFISFLVTLVTRYDVSLDKFNLIKVDRERASNWEAYMAITGAVFSSLTEMGDYTVVSKLVLKILLSEMLTKLPLANMFGMLQMLCLLESLSNISLEAITTLGEIVSHYMMDVVSCALAGDEPSCSSIILKCEFFIKPCLLLLCKTGKLLDNVLHLLASMMTECNLSLSGNTDFDVPRRVNEVSSVLILIFKCAPVSECLSLSREVITNILKIMYNLLFSEDVRLDIEERHSVHQAFDRLRSAVCEAKFWNPIDMEGIQKET